MSRRNNNRNPLRRTTVLERVGRRQETEVEKLLKIMARKDQNDLMTPKVPDVPRLMLKRDKVYTFDRSYSFDLVASGTAPTSQSYSFSLAGLPNSSDFTNLFDQYRIVQAEARFIPVYAPGEFPGSIYTAIDYDDAVDISTTEALQYQTLQITGLYQPFLRTLNPTAADIVYNGNVTVAYGQRSRNEWIDVASPSVPHYGLKVAITTITGAPSSITLGSIVLTVTLQCKNPR